MTASVTGDGDAGIMQGGDQAVDALAELRGNGRFMSGVAQRHFKLARRAGPRSEVRKLSDERQDALRDGVVGQDALTGGDAVVAQQGDRLAGLPAECLSGGFDMDGDID